MYAGVDYADVLAAAENNLDGYDVILWEGESNEISFFEPDLDEIGSPNLSDI